MKKLFTCLLLFSTLQYVSAQSCADGTYSFDDDISTILSTKCGNCHGAQGGFSVATYASTLAGGTSCGPGVTPGTATAAASSIIDKTQWVNGGAAAVCGANMPTSGTPLTAAEYMAIEAWIAAGAQEACPVPANPCDMAAVLACGDNITDANGVEPVPAITCGAGGDGGNGFWYTFAGTGDDITIDLSASDYDTQIAVYDGTCAALNCIVGDDDGGTGSTSLATFTSVAGTDYLIYVDGFSGATGNLGLSVTCTPPPVQCTPGVADNTGVGCDTAIDICGECSVSGTNVGNGPASDLCAVPACTGADGSFASWLTFVGDGGTYTFNTNGSDFDTQIAVFTDDGAGCLACEGGDDDGGAGTQSAVTIATTAGTTYFIVVDGFGTNDGNWILNVTDGTGTDGEGNAINIPCPSAPEACPEATACVPLAADAAAPAAVVSSESSCQADGLTTDGGVIDPITCPAGQTAEYATDGATFSTTLPVYDQLNSITVTTRCVCDSDPTDVSPTAEVTTVPDPCICTPVADPTQTAVDCANAIDICGASCEVTGTNVGNGPASDFCAVPACTGADGSFASWLTFVGDGGTYTFNTNGSDFDTQIAVFTDDGAGCLACEGGDDDGGVGTQSAVTIATTAGTTYFIVVDGFGTNDGNWILNITDGTGVDGEGNPLAIPCPSAPEACPESTVCVPLAADAAAPAAVVSSESSCQADGLTTDGGVIDPITCPAGQIAEYATDGATFSATLPVYDQLNPVTVTTRCVCDSDPTDVSPTAEVTTVPDPCICTPVADPSQTAVDCANAIDICGASCPVTGTNVGNSPASDFCAVPACTGADGSFASWLTFVGDGGTYTFNTNGSDFDTQIAVFTDDGAGCLACEGGDDDGGVGTQSAVTIATTAGTTYFIVVDGFGTNDGNWILNITDGTGVDGEGNPLVIACPSAPAACPAVVAACPTSDFSPPFAPEMICDAGVLTYPMAGGVFTITDTDGTQLGGMMWFDGNDPTTATAVVTTDPVVHSGADPCATDPTVTHYAFVQCDADMDGVFDLNAGDSWVEVATHSFDVFAPAQMPTITRDDDVCNYTITEACTGDVLDVTMTTAAPGDDPAAISVMVTTENGCTSSFMVDPAMCPMPNAVCDGLAAPPALTSPVELCNGDGPIDVCFDMVDATQGLNFDLNLDGAPAGVIAATPGANANELCIQLPMVANEGCDLETFTITFNAITCDNGEDIPGPASPSLADDLNAGGGIVITVAPTLTVNTAGDGTCMMLTAELVATDGTVCAAATPVACAADGETLDYDFSGDVTFTPPAACPLPTLTGTLTCGGCTLPCDGLASPPALTSPVALCDGDGPIDVCFDMVDATQGLNFDLNLDGAPAGVIAATPGVNPNELCIQLPMVANQGCDLQTFNITFNAITCNNGADIAGPASPSLADDLNAGGGIDITVAPTLAVNTAGDGACGSLTAELVATDGTICASATSVTCSMDGDALNYDFSADVTFVPPAACPLPTLSGTLTCSACVCEEEITYNVFAPSCDMIGATIELFDNTGASLGTMPLGSEGGNGTFGIQPCGDYTMSIVGAPACYTDEGGNVGPIAFATDGSGTSNQSFTTSIANIPTVGEWGLIMLGLLMSITAVVGIRQRREEEVYS